MNTAPNAVSIDVEGREARPCRQAQPAMDEGMRRWCESCPCCLSNAYPEAKATLNVQRRARPTWQPGLRGSGGG